MPLKITSPIGILNVVELVLTIIVAGLVADLNCLTCGNSAYRTQFVDAIVFGYLMISLLVASGLVITELDKTFRMLVAGFGSILWLSASALILESADTGLCQSSLFGSDSYDRAVAGGVIGLAIFITHAVDAYFAYRHSD